jgi:DNA-binding CsgD family transcriptional regulator
MATVKSHIYHIYEKLQVKNKVEAAKKATGNR